MIEKELYVKLLIPDTTAITARRTLEQIGLKVKALERMDYYKITLGIDDPSFFGKISKVDVLVNANKHKAFEKIEKKIGFVDVIVQGLNPESESFLSVLRERLGFTNVKKIETGVLWRIKAEKKEAEKAVNELLYSRHYQKYILL